jgi:5-(carboxyamino)imidazole ribonucleotide synthase
MTITPIEPGSTLGILGGGQLARMLSLAASRLGLKTHIYAPEADQPAFDVTPYHTIGAYEDEAALSAFSEKVAAVTYEFENIPVSCAEIVARKTLLRPGVEALRKTQDRLIEKEWIASLGLPVAPYARVDSVTDLQLALSGIGAPSILKTRRFGYDGKGQFKLSSAADSDAAWAALNGYPSILEGFVPFSCEVSVVVARGADGAFAPFALCCNEHADHILSITHAPANLAASLQDQAFAMAKTIGDALNYVGVFAVEMFVISKGGTDHLVINEIAPRVHNSGHWTMDGAVTSQFEQHIRAVCGWPLGSAELLGTCEMHNLIGAQASDWQHILSNPQAHLHLYGKADIRAGRKMGHVNFVRPL